MKTNLKRAAAVVTTAAVIFTEGAAFPSATVLANTSDAGIYSQMTKEEVENIKKLTEAEYAGYAKSDAGVLLIDKVTEQSDYTKAYLQEDSVIRYIGTDGTMQNVSNKDADGNVLFDVIYRQNTSQPGLFLVEKGGKQGYIDGNGTYSEISAQERTTETVSATQGEQETETLEPIVAEIVAGADSYNYDSEKKIVLVYDEVEINGKKQAKLNGVYDCSGETAVQLTIDAGDLYETTYVECRNGTGFVTGHGLYDGSNYYVLKKDGTLVSVPVTSGSIYWGTEVTWTTVVGKWLETDLYYLESYVYANHNYSYDLFDSNGNYVDSVKDCTVDYKGYSVPWEPYVNQNTYAINDYGYAAIRFLDNTVLYGLNGVKQSDLYIVNSVLSLSGNGLAVYMENSKFGCASIRDISKDAAISYENVYAHYTGNVDGAFGTMWLDDGTMARSKEAYDKEANQWYWLDADGIRARDKFVFIPDGKDRVSGKWVYYDNHGYMVKGAIKMGESEYMFDEITGEALHLKWAEIDGTSYWYENGIKQGTQGRGKEIYDSESDAWYWLDAVDNGKKAVSKDVYQESNGGKWVRYDAEGHMVKGWNTNANGTYYFDRTTGAMQKGNVTIEGKDYCFDTVTGIME